MFSVSFFLVFFILFSIRSRINNSNNSGNVAPVQIALYSRSIVPCHQHDSHFQRKIFKSKVHFGARPNRIKSNKREAFHGSKIPLYISRDEEIKNERYIECFKQEWMNKAEESDDGMNNNNDRKKTANDFCYSSEFPI